MSILALPRELLDRIVHFLHSDRASLLACALVHTHLRRPSQQLLFRELRVYEEDSAARVGAILRAAPELAAAVRELALRHAMPGMLYAALNVTFPALYTLRFEQLTRAPAGGLPRPMPRTLPHLQSIRYLSISYTDEDQIAALLCALPRVVTLEFVEYSVRHNTLAFAHASLPPALVLLHLDLSGLSNIDVLNEVARWLCAPGSHAVARLETLRTRTYLPTEAMKTTLPETLQVVPSLLLTTVAPTIKKLFVFVNRYIRSM
jgi:hypothetical protein